jgi:hypothetical protein
MTIRAMRSEEAARGLGGDRLKLRNHDYPEFGEDVAHRWQGFSRILGFADSRGALI